MDNKKTLYWAIGVVIVLLVLFMFWGASRNKPGNPQDPTSAQSGSQAESGMSAGSDSHAGMNHGTAQESAGNGAGSTGAGTGTDSADPGYTRYMEEETAIMDRMMRDMNLPEESGNAALDFIDGMIPHHEAAVSMAESYLNNGGDHAELKPLAEDIITAQKSEIAQMKDMRKSIADSGKKDQEKADAYRAEYERMMAGHHDGHGMGHDGSTGGNGNAGGSNNGNGSAGGSNNGNGSADGSNAGNSNSTGATHSIDAAFAAGMIMHHQMAVDMAKAILDNTDEEDVLSLSRQIIDTQEEEISLMEKVLQES